MKNFTDKILAATLFSTIVCMSICLASAKLPTQNRKPAVLKVEKNNLKENVSKYLSSL